MNVSSWSIRNPIPAILLFLLLTLVGAMGFVSSTTGELAQPPSVVLAARLAMSVIPAVIGGLAEPRTRHHDRAATDDAVRKRIERTHVGRVAHPDVVGVHGRKVFTAAVGRLGSSEGLVAVTASAAADLIDRGVIAYSSVRT